MLAESISIKVTDLVTWYSQSQSTKVDYLFQPNSLTVISGESGSGKSTLLRSLAGLYPIRSGNVSLTCNDKILFDYQRDFQNSPFHECYVDAPFFPKHLFSYMPQDDFFIEPTFKSVVKAFGSGSDDDASSALNLAGLSSLFETNRYELESPIGWNGHKLSGGQRKRLSLARSLFRRSAVLLLDEPTSGLDPLTDRQIFSTLLQLANNMTIIAVSHSPYFLNHAPNLIQL